MSVELTRMREFRGLNQRQLARLSGVSESMLSRIENGYVKNPGVRTAVKLAHALGVTADVLFPIEDHKEGAAA